MANAIVWSDNIYFADMALKIGWDPLKDFYLSLGIGKTGFPFQLPVVSSKIANTRDNAFSGNKHLLASTGFGQGEMIISPLQMATVFSQLANSGVAMAPRVVADTRRLSGNDYQVVDEFPSEPWIEGVLSTEIIDSLKPVLRRVMTEGTGRKARQDGVTVYAKTGTAQVGSGDDLRNIAWFIGFTDPSMGYTRLVCVTMEVDVDMGDMKYDIAQKLLMP